MSGEATEDISARLKRERQVKIDSGENCSRCGIWIFTLNGGPGHRRECIACRAISEDRGEVSHTKYIRCPKCGESWNPWEGDDYDVFEEGPSSVTCGECDHEFEVTTTVSYTFTSPERVAEPEDGEEADTQEEDAT